MVDLHLWEEMVLWKSPNRICSYPQHMYYIGFDSYVFLTRFSESKHLVCISVTVPLHRTYYYYSVLFLTLTLV